MHFSINWSVILINLGNIGSHIGNQWHLKGEIKPLISPTTGEEWGKLHLATDEEIAHAIDYVKKGPVIDLTPHQRSDVLRQISQTLLEKKEKLAQAITLEMGKPIAEARGEVIYTANYFGWFAEEAKRIYGKTIPSSKEHAKLEVLYEPIGPTAIITPWNFPLAMAARKIAPAIAAGCPVIVKPSSYTPATFLMMMTICYESELPPNSLHALVGNTEKIGKALMEASHIRKVSFTGSYEAGLRLYIQGAHTLKKATMELGGNAPLIIFDDAHLETAIDGAITSKFRMSGQTCICANRLFVHKKILPSFLPRFIEKVRALKIGDPFKEDTKLSTTLHPQSLEKAKAHVADAIRKGAKPHLNARHPYEPEILTDVTSAMQIFNEETFGPVAPIIEFEEEEEVINLANQTQYGLAAYLFTEGLKRSQHLTKALQFGIIGLNDGSPSAVEGSFGGIKDSGFGREGGPTGIYEYLTEKFISQKL